ncbi:MAG: hypothetical protein MZV49_01525 [Rhodopseudomonas palustris]|nr:hypothetical protein [Rhodopseudomonas palustris]
MVDDRASNQMREERDHQKIVFETIAIGLALRRVDQISDLLKREERDRERQHQFEDRDVGAEQRVQIGRRERRVFEIADQRQIERDADREQQARRPIGPGALGKQSSAGEIDGDAREQHEQIPRIPERVEGQRGAD